MVLCPNKLIQKRSGDIPIQRTHTHTNYVTHLPDEIAGASGGVIGEIQLRVPLEHYSAVTLTLHQCCQCTQHRKRLTESCSLLLAESKVPCPAWRLKPPSTHVTFDILRSTHTQ